MRITTLIILIITLQSSVCSVYSQSKRENILKIIDKSEYNRLMNLSLDDFDQSYGGFRQYSSNAKLIYLIIPEYIEVNELSIYEAANLHWHLGQIMAFNGDELRAISEMEMSVVDTSPIFWKCYVEGTIAFLRNDRLKLEESIKLLKLQDNQMNLDVLEKLSNHFEEQYYNAYNTPY